MPGSTSGYRTTRARARAVYCPLCHAWPGDPCIDQRGRDQETLHQERHRAAILAGAPTTQEVAARPSRGRHARPAQPVGRTDG